MNNLEIKNTIEKLFLKEILPLESTKEIAIDFNHHASSYQALDKVGLFETIEHLDLATFTSDILPHVAYYDSSMALSILSNKYAHELGCELRSSIIPILYSIGEIEEKWKSRSDFKVQLVPNITKTIYIPKINKRHMDFFTSNVSDLKRVKTIGCYSFPSATLKLKKISSQKAFSIEIEKFNKCYHEARVASCSLLLNFMRSCLDLTHKFSKERYQGGKQLADWSQIQYMLNEQESLFLLYSTAYKAISKDTPERELKSLLLQIKKHLVPLVDQCVQIHGGLGYTKEFPIEKKFREARHLQFIFGEFERDLFNLNYEK